MTTVWSEQQPLLLLLFLLLRRLVLFLQQKYNEGFGGMLILYIWTVLSSRTDGAKFPGFLGGLRKAVTQHIAWLSADGNDDRWDLGQRLRERALARASVLIVHSQRLRGVRAIEAVLQDTGVWATRRIISPKLELKYPDQKKKHVEKCVS